MQCCFLFSSNAPQSEGPGGELLHKSSTSSSLQQGSSSSDDALSTDVVTHRHINSPRILESESGHHPTDFLQQFNRRLANEEAQKKRLRELVRTRTEPAVATAVTTDTDDDVDSAKRQSSIPTPRGSSGHRHLKHSNSSSSTSSRVTRTNTYAGRSEHRAPTDVNMVANMAEMAPIMPQQYRPNQPPPYRVAIERKEQIKTNGIPEIERIKQTVNSARAKQLYAKSLQMFEQQENSQPSLPTSNAMTKSDTRLVSSKPSATTNKNLLADIPDNNNTIGIVKANDKKFVIKRASSTKTTRHNMNADLSGRSSMFYQPGSSGQTFSKLGSSLNTHKSVNPTNPALFYRPTQPPPYKEALKQRTVKPDLIDSLGGESLV